MSEARFEDRVAPEARWTGRVPRHVAIIMDGNRRWAARRRLPVAAGHRAGAKNVRPVADACAEAGVEFLTLFAFSTENWQRPPHEIRPLMKLMREFLSNDIEELRERGVRLRIVGDRGRFARDLRALMDRAERMTGRNRGLTLNIAAGYGGRWDIAQAARRMAEDARAGRLDPERVDDDSVRFLPESLRGRAAAAGPVHPYGRRPAHQQLPVVGHRLHRAVLRPGLLAGFRGSRTRGRLLRLRCPCTALRPPRLNRSRGGSC